MESNETMSSVGMDMARIFYKACMSMDEFKAVETEYVFLKLFNIDRRIKKIFWNMTKTDL